MKKFLKEYKYVILTIVVIIGVVFFTGCKKDKQEGCYCVSTKVESLVSNGCNGLLCPEKPVTFMCQNQKGCTNNSENLKCTWYPLYCGWGEHAYCSDSDGCFSPICFGCDICMIQLYDTGNEYGGTTEIDYRNTTKAEIGTDVIIKGMKVYTDTSYLENAGITPDGFDADLIDLKELLKDFLNDQANVLITVVLEFENNVELSGFNIEGIIYTQGTWKNETTRINRGNPENAFVNYTSLNIQEGKHKVVFTFELDAIQKYLIDGKYQITYNFRKYED